MKNYMAFPDGINPRGGMELRDYFAAKALQGLLSNLEWGETPEEISIIAYNHADAMMKTRES
jgi:hypothetical protein